MKPLPWIADVEARVYHAVVDDGLADLVLGAVLLASAAGNSTGHRWLGGAAGGAAVSVWSILRRYVTSPRAGVVRFQPARLSRIQRAARTAALTAALCVTGFILLIASGWTSPTIGVPALALTLGVPTAVVANLFDLPRFYAYATAIMLDLMASPWHGQPFLLSGTVVAISGAFVLTAFMRRTRRTGTMQ